MKRELGVTVREYRDSDEQSWVNARVQAFLDSSYRDDVHQYRERYENPSVRVVAAREEDQKILGFLDVEYEERTGQSFPDAQRKSGVLWHLGVLPAYRRQGLACAMWQQAKERLQAAGVQHIKAWTQDDIPANSWYRQQRFTLTHSSLNVYVRGMVGQSPLKDLLPGLETEWKYGQIRNLNFEAPLEYREELQKISYRMHEVRVYEIEL